MKKNSLKYLINKKEHFLLFIIFILSLIIRFWWFPHNVYFGYDQARDAIISQDIYLNLHLKVLGPSAGTEGLFHGPAYWYLIGPVYLLFKGNPLFTAGFVSVINCFGVFLIYLLSKELFNSKIAILSSLFYAFSFAQTQYSLYFANPSPAVLTIIIFYLGWALLIKRNQLGWIFVALGLGLSIQFEFFLIYLFTSIILMIIIFRKDIFYKFKWKLFMASLFMLLITLLTFIISEIKFGFRTSKVLLGIFLPKGRSNSPVELATSTFQERIGMEVIYNTFAFLQKWRDSLAIVLLLIIVIAVIKTKLYKKQLLFLFIWLISNLFLDLFKPPQLYYIGIGLSVPVIVLCSLAVGSIIKVNKLFGWLLIIIILLSNLFLINKFNKNGPMNDLYVQQNMFLEDEKKVLDIIYPDAKGDKFIVNSLTMPYKIKTTWAYLFNWYGNQKYGYLPYWGGENVPGYEGNLPIPDSTGYIRYAILEPNRGIPENLKKEFIDSENGFNKPVWEQNIGSFIIQKRVI